MLLQRFHMMPVEIISVRPCHLSRFGSIKSRSEMEYSSSTELLRVFGDAFALRDDPCT